MSQILVVTGSARPHSANAIIVKEVVKNLEARDGVEVKVADLAEMNLPYMNGAMPPSADGYEITDPAAKAWSELVKASDGVVFVVPEYNHSLSGIQKNAIDWLYHEWTDKPAAFVGYGAYASKHSWEHFQEINSVIKLKLGQAMTGLKFGEEIDWDGTVKDTEVVHGAISKTLDELLAAME